MKKIIKLTKTAPKPSMFIIDEVDKQIEEMARWMTDEEKATTYLNVKLSYTTK